MTRRGRNTSASSTPGTSSYDPAPAASTPPHLGPQPSEWIEDLPNSSSSDEDEIEMYDLTRHDDEPLPLPESDSPDQHANQNHLGPGPVWIDELPCSSDDEDDIHDLANDEPQNQNRPATPGPAPVRVRGPVHPLAKVTGWKYDWLEYDTDGLTVTKMWCRICKEYSTTTPHSTLNPGQKQCCNLDAFVTGTTNIKKSTAYDHQRSRTHKQAMAAKVAKETPAATDLGKYLHRLDDITLQRMCKLFDWAYVVAKKELPFTMFPTLVATEGKHGTQDIA